MELSAYRCDRPEVKLELYGIATAAATTSEMATPAKRKKKSNT